jgi:hypothetical protein
MSIFPNVVLDGGTDWVRHAHETVVRFLKQQLAVNGWVNPPTNFGATPLTFEEVQPEEAGVDLVANTVAITLGDVPEQRLEQLGGGLYSLAIPVFIDVYGEKSSISVSVADDVRRLLTDRSIPMFDFSDPANPVPKAGAYIDFEQVVGPRRPAAAAEASAELRRNWRVVKATAISYFTADF